MPKNVIRSPSSWGFILLRPLLLEQSFTVICFIIEMTHMGGPTDIIRKAARIIERRIVEPERSEVGEKPSLKYTCFD